jgi:hypothetical protein
MLSKRGERRTNGPCSDNDRKEEAPRNFAILIESAALLQLRVLCFCLFKDRNLRIGIFPER